MPLSQKQFHAKIKQLEWIEFAPDDPPAERTIPAAWIAELLAEPQRTTEFPVRVKNAIIEGDLSVQFAVFQYEFWVLDSEFTGNVLLRRSQMKRGAEFHACHFRGGLYLDGVHAPELFINRCTLEGEGSINHAVCGSVSLSGTHAKRAFHMAGAELNTLALSSVEHEGKAVLTQFEGPADFNTTKATVVLAEGTQFADTADFRFFRADSAFFTTVKRGDGEPIVARIGGQAAFSHAAFARTVEFMGVVFAGPASFDVVTAQRARFQPVRLAGKNFVTRFEQRAAFMSMRVEEGLYMSGCVFRGECEMTLMRIGGMLSFEWYDDADFFAATFEGDFSLDQSRIGGRLVCSGVTFGGTTSMRLTRVESVADFQTIHWHEEPHPCTFKGMANFHQISCGGDVWFSGTKFEEDAYFSDANIGVDASFAGVVGHATFNKSATFDRMKVGGQLECYDVEFDGVASFANLDVGANASFENARFKAGVALTLADVKGKLVFDGATFEGALDLRDAHASIFTAPEVASLDAHGFTFGRIDGDVRGMLQRQKTYDLQLYQQAEAFLRSIGDEEAAGTIYLDRRKREMRMHGERARDSTLPKRRRFNAFARASSEFVQRWLFRFGVRPYQLAIYIVIVVIAGTVVFSGDHAVIDKDKKTPRKLSTAQAFGYSARVFMPIGDLPSGATLLPSDHYVPHTAMTYEAYATVQRLAGLLLAPLAIAAMTGVLVRKRS